jgi:hypothetical protein
MLWSVLSHAIQNFGTTKRPLSATGPIRVTLALDDRMVIITSP